MNGLVVSVSSVVGFVGLIIHRMLFGPDHRLLVPASLLVGGHSWLLPISWRERSSHPPRFLSAQ